MHRIAPDLKLGGEEPTGDSQAIVDGLAPSQRGKMRSQMLSEGWGTDEPPNSPSSTTSFGCLPRNRGADRGRRELCARCRKREDDHRLRGQGHRGDAPQEPWEV